MAEIRPAFVDEKGLAIIFGWSVKTLRRNAARVKGHPFTGNRASSVTTWRNRWIGCASTALSLRPRPRTRMKSVGDRASIR